MSLTWQEAEASRWPWVDWKDRTKGLKDSWATPLDRRNMLFARLVSDSLRAIAPELVAGVYEESELTDAIEVTSTVQHQGPAIPPGHVVKADGEIVPASEGEVIDASYEVVNEELSQSDDAPPFDESVDFKFATARQVKRIEELRDKLSIDAETYASILAKRGVERVDQLSSDQADEIIQRMESKLTVAKASSLPGLSMIGISTQYNVRRRFQLCLYAGRRLTFGMGLEVPRAELADMESNQQRA